MLKENRLLKESLLSMHSGLLVESAWLHILIFGLPARLHYDKALEFQSHGK